MIKDKREYREYVMADREALNNPNWKSVVWRYLKTMRKAEYYTNCRGWLAKIYRFRLRVLSEKQEYVSQLIHSVKDWDFFIMAQLL